MAWASPFTAVAASIYTAAQANQIRDNLNELRITPQYRCSAYHSTTQTITAGNLAALSLDTEQVDTASMHDPSSDNSKITIPSGGSGTYFIFASTHVENTAATPQAELFLRLNGSSYILARRLIPDPGVALYMTPLEISTFYSLGAGDYIEMVGQATTANVTYGVASLVLATRLEVIGPLPAA